MDTFTSFTILEQLKLAIQRDFDGKLKCMQWTVGSVDIHNNT